MRAAIPHQYNSIFMINYEFILTKNHYFSLFYIRILINTNKLN